MSKVYNNQSNITMGFSNFLLNSSPFIRKSQLNFIPSVMFGMISSQSCSSYDIAKFLKLESKCAQFDSIVKRINRLWHNKLFDGKLLFNNVISSILDSYKIKHNDNRIHITFDHMFSHDNYAILMFSMRIGTQGIPIYFDCFSNGKQNDEAFKIDTIINGISQVHELFKNKDFDLIFLADRWFSSTRLFDYIDSLGHTYCVRIKGNIDVFKDGTKTKAKKLKHRKYHAVVHNDVFITNNKFKTNIVYSNSLDTSTPWIIATNKNIDSAIKNYSYRFGSVECLFKNQKSNGFRLGKISNMNIHSFTNMYSVLCICLTYLTLVGADFSKNSRCYKHIRITTHKKYLINGKKIKKRIMSLFRTGLTLFLLAINSSIYVRLPMTFILYDI